jgi:hypothetical protein
MAEDVGLEEMMVPGRRVLVVNDLGPVHKGDHLIIVAGVVVALDTSRRPEDVALPGGHPRPPWSGNRPSISAASTMPARPPRKRHTKITLNEKQVLLLIRDHQPISSMAISDKLNLQRDDLPARGKITRILKALLETRQIKRHQDDRTRSFRYELIPNANETEGAVNA